jgi:hypothetical protein
MPSYTLVRVGGLAVDTSGNLLLFFNFGYDRRLC